MINNKTNRRKRGIPAFRRTISLMLLLSGIILIFSSVVLYIGPPTHIAFFTDWIFWGLSKMQWNAIHLVNGIVFTLGIIIHTCYNWKSIIAYLRNHHRKLIILTGDFIIALLVTLVFCVCSIMFLPPARQIMHLGHVINQKYIKDYGVFPYGNENRYLLWKTTRYLALDEHELIQYLRESGINIESRTQSISEIAEKNKVPTVKVLEVIRSLLFSEYVNNPNKKSITRTE